jgi:hypothetical protein
MNRELLRSISDLETRDLRESRSYAPALSMRARLKPPRYLTNVHRSDPIPFYPALTPKPIHSETMAANPLVGASMHAAVPDRLLQLIQLLQSMDYNLLEIQMPAANWSAWQKQNEALAPMINWQTSFLITALNDIHKAIPVMWEQTMLALSQKGMECLDSPLTLRAKPMNNPSFEDLIETAPHTPCVSPFGDLEEFLIQALHQSVSIHTMTDFTLHLTDGTPILRDWYSSTQVSKFRQQFQTFEATIHSSRCLAQHIPRWFQGRIVTRAPGRVERQAGLFEAWFRFISSFLTSASGKHQKVWEYLGWRSPHSPSH